MFSSLVIRALLYKLFYELIFLIIAEVLRFLVCQCVLSFSSSIWLDAAIAINIKV